MLKIDVDNQARRLAAAGRRLPSAEREGRHCTADYCAGGGLLRRGFDRHVDRRTDAAAADLTQRSISPKDDEAAKFTSVILATTEDTGADLEKMGRQYPQPKLVLYRGATRTGCGTGQSVMGPSIVLPTVRSISTCHSTMR